MPFTFNIKVISDPVCPQCYLAKKRLDRAIQLYKRVIPNGKHDTFLITWHPYYLANNKSSPAITTGAIPPHVLTTSSTTTTANTNNDDESTATTLSCDPATKTCTTVTPESISIPVQDAMTRRYGGSEATASAMQDRLRSKGLSEGIRFSFGNRIGSSRDAHRLIWWARCKDAEGGGEHGDGDGEGGSIQNVVVNELFRRYFEEDGDITSHDMLVEIGVKAGMDREEVREMLVEGRGGDVVDGEAEEAASGGIEGVPVFGINGVARIDGAQDVEDFLMEFVKVRDGTGGESAGE